MTLIDQTSELLEEKVVAGILLYRKPIRRRGFEGSGSGTVFDIVFLLIALSWHCVYRIWDPVVASEGAVYLATTNNQLVYFKVNEKVFRRSLGGVSSQRDLNELENVTFEEDGDDKEIHFRFIDSSETTLYFEGNNSEIESFVSKTIQSQST